MRKTSALDLRGLATLFSSLEKETSFLPPHTPIFLADGYGRVLKSRGHLISRLGSSSLCGMMSEENYRKYLSVMETGDVCVAETAGEKKSFILISKEKYNILRGVVTRFSDEYCKDLSEYFDRLCLYRDYLFSFGDISHITAGSHDVTELIITLIGGVYALTTLSHPDTDSTRSAVVDADTYIQKLLRLIARTSDCGFDRLSFESPPVTAFIGVSMHVTRFLAACASILIRQSGGNVCASLERVGTKVFFSLSAKVCGGENGSIYDKAVSSAANTVIGFSIFRSNGIIKAVAEFDIILPEKVVISDITLLSENISELLSDRQLREIIFTIS